MDSRDELMTLMDAWEQGFPTFASEEASLILKLLQSGGQAKLSTSPNWDKLEKFFFVLPHFYYLWKNCLPSEVSERFLKECRHQYMSNLTNNEQRLKFIADLAKIFQANGLKVIFLKGAAELVLFRDDTDFLARRFMTDVDVLCRREDMSLIDAILQKEGHELNHFDQDLPDRESIIEYSVSNYGHSAYNSSSKKNLEVHPAVPCVESYPEDFTQLLFENAIQIDLHGTPVFLPDIDYSFVYHFCNAASRRDQNVIVDGEIGCLFDLLSGNAGDTRTPDFINKRLDAFQLYVLTRMSDFIEAATGHLNEERIHKLLVTVSDTYLRDMYLDLASHALGERFPMKRNVRRSDIDSARNRYMAGICVPLLMVKKLEQSVAERLAPIIEARMMERIKEAILRKLNGNIPQFICKWIERKMNHCS